ncbi:MAG: hypothetical protein E7632_10225 [Ruminococcaceae bacterium]|nr:hypothetical protein [Oscillospiraceae bacterium]
MIHYPCKTCEELGINDEAITKRENIRFYDVREIDAFRIYGLQDNADKSKFVRMPTDVAERVSVNVKNLHVETTGGRIRFSTTSRFVALRAVNVNPTYRMNAPIIASNGFDLYVNLAGRDTFAGVFRPPFSGYNEGFHAIVDLEPGMKDITINFPINSPVGAVYIGLDETAELVRRADYRHEKPVLYYGSSITHGVGASRPGMIYPAIISRRLDCNFINLGMNGSAKAEDTMCAYLASLDPSVFVMDYDYNAPNAAYLKETHEKLYLTFRAAHPDTPVVMVGKPNSWPNTDCADRRDVIFETYDAARKRGEKVIFVDGQSLFQGHLHEECTVDGCHPNDVGFARMADAIGRAVNYALAM